MYLCNEDKLRTSDDIDTLISAEIPNEVDDAQLYQIVKTCMVHGPCGRLNPNALCMVEGKCSKHFPNEFFKVTSLLNNR